MSDGFGLGRLSGRQLAILWAILSAGLLLRILGLDWGLPPSGPERAAAGLRSSYSQGEDAILKALAQDGPGLHGAGAPHLRLTQGTLAIAEAAGAFEGPWRKAWREMPTDAFERVYVIARLPGVVVDLGSALLAALVALRLGGPGSGLWAAALVALSPGHILQAGQGRPDATATACVLLLCLAVLSNGGPVHVGLVAGLAAAVKLTAAPLALAALAVDAIFRGRSPARLGRLAGGAALGFLLGEPWLLTAGGQGSSTTVVANLGHSLLDWARFSVGAPAALLAIAGFALLWRRGGLEGRLLPVVLAAGIVALLPQQEPLLRHQLPLAALSAVAAAFAIGSAPRWGKPLGAAALFVAGAASFSVVAHRLAPHPANLALRVLERAAEPGQTVSRARPGLPPLDPTVYPEGSIPVADWVVLGGPLADEAALRERYERTAVFRGHSRFAWATWGERGAPSDWMDSHPTLTIYRRR